MTSRRSVTLLPNNRMVVHLTDRELQVIRLVAAGRRNREIADALRISIKTVEFHLNNVFGKLSAYSRTEAVIRAWQAGMVQLSVS